MAGEPWNRVNIPFPGALSSVRIHFSKKTGANVKALLVESTNVLKIINSELLQTEVRVLYQLLYNLENSFRGNKTFKCLQQVEQCINRLKNMKLDVALQDLTDLCPNEIQRGVSLKTGNCGVPSQPMLEWLGLKLLGAAQLMSCTLTRCSRAFIFTKQQLNLEEFVVLNMVIIGMVSRLWVICRGILISLPPLYKQLLVLLREVAHAQPMPYLTDFSLPADMTQFFPPSDILYLKKQSKQDSRAKRSKETTVNQGHARNTKEDLGVALKRDIVVYADTKPLLEVIRHLREAPKGKDLSQETKAAKKKQKFRKQLRDATTFTDMAKHLEEMILWCKSENMGKEKCFLTFLRLKCQKLKSLEASGYNIQRKLQTFRKEACWASSPQGSMPKTCCFSAAVRRNAHLRTRLHSLRSQFKSSLFKKNSRKRRQRRTHLSGVSEDCPRSRTTHEPSPQNTESDGYDDIDDIFSSISL
ncbi:nucleolus and neural progenitor protein [Betta splendens]|uniref:Nucleolus and neural progenitor protein n=1 Tax=Betta splendens TaxID=158456 RepID=A0A6P7LFE8_BETSP|nr:nucleolus and neural progenitor protein [Betta splendens]